MSFAAVFLLAFLLTGLVYSIYSRRDILNNYRKNSSDILMQLDARMSDKYNDFASRIDGVCNNLSFSTPMGSFLNSENEASAVLNGNVADTLSELSASDELISSVYLYTKKQFFTNYTQIPIEDIRYENTVMYRHFVYYPSDNVDWFPAMENPLFEDSGKIIPIVYRRVIDGNNIYFIVNISQYALSEYITNAYQSFDNIFIVDRENSEIVNCDENTGQVLEQMKYDILRNDGTLFSQAKIGDSEYLITRMGMAGSEWKVYALTAVSSLTPNTRKLYMFMLVVFAAIVLIGVFFIRVITRQLTKPLEQLADIMKGTVDSNLEVRFTYEYQDEVGVLGNSYNEMVDKIGSLIEQLNDHIEALKEEKENVKRIQKQKRKAELAVLEMQINPHFLYNTLNMITWQAYEQGVSEISILSNALGKYFRISLSRGREIITVAEEEEHVRSYLEIQKIRYKNKLNYEIDLPRDIMDLYTIKLVLQPLVENALYHGIKEKPGEGCIQIYGGTGESDTEGRFVEIIVEDDGLGIEAEKLRRLNDGLEEGVIDSNSGYGVYNVNNRLRLYYGDCFGLKLESDPGEGTRAIIRFPVMKSKEQMEDVSVNSGGR